MSDLTGAGKAKRHAARDCFNCLYLGLKPASKCSNNSTPPRSFPLHVAVSLPGGGLWSSKATFNMESALTSFTDEFNNAPIGRAALYSYAIRNVLHSTFKLKSVNQASELLLLGYQVGLFPHQHFVFKFNNSIAVIPIHLHSYTGRFGHASHSEGDQQTVS